MGDRDEDSGRYTDQYPDEAFLDAIREFDGTAGTTEIADEVGCDRRTAYIRLNELADNGVVKGRKVANSLIWSAVENSADS